MISWMTVLIYKLLPVDISEQTPFEESCDNSLFFSISDYDDG